MRLGGNMVSAYPQGNLFADGYNEDLQEHNSRVLVTIWASYWGGCLLRTRRAIHLAEVFYKSDHGPNHRESGEYRLRWLRAAQTAQRDRRIGLMLALTASVGRFRPERRRSSESELG
jgi:hypothetical protein